jgi:hypothetical protein
MRGDASWPIIPARRLACPGCFFLFSPIVSTLDFFDRYPKFVGLVLQQALVRLAGCVAELGGDLGVPLMNPGQALIEPRQDRGQPLGVPPLAPASIVVTRRRARSLAEDELRRPADDPIISPQPVDSCFEQLFPKGDEIWVIDSHHANGRSTDSRGRGPAVLPCRRPQSSQQLLAAVARRSILPISDLSAAKPVVQPTTRPLSPRPRDL